MRRTLFLLLLASTSAPAFAADDRASARAERREAARAERAEAREERRSDRPERSQQSERAEQAPPVQYRAPDRAPEQPRGDYAVQREERRDANRDRRADRRDFDAQALERQAIEQRRVQAEQGRDLRQQQRDLRRDERADRREQRIDRRAEWASRTPPVVSRVPREGTQPPPVTTSHRRSNGHRWNGGWRNDRRYDWYNWRNRNRSIFRLGFYFDPFGWNYRPYSIGWRLWPSYYQSSYWLHDPWMYRLPTAYPGTRWIRYYDDAILVDTWNGEVVDVIYNFFW